MGRRKMGEREPFSRDDFFFARFPALARQSVCQVKENLAIS